METLVSGGMSDFLNAFYRQQQNHLLKYQPNGYYDDKSKLKDMTSELQLLVQKLCRVCGGAVSQFQTSTKFELKDALLNCMKIDIRTDQAGLPSRVCQTCADQLTRAMFQHHQLGTWPLLSHLTKFDWSGQNAVEKAEPPQSDCTLAQTLPSLCTISAKHGFLLVPEHTDENRVRFVRLTELATNDVAASYILHIYIDLTWDLSIHGQTVHQSNLTRMPHLPRKVTRENAEELFQAILALDMCPGITGLDTICRILSHRGPAVFHDHQSQKLAMEDRFAKTVRHTECDIVSSEAKQCDACTRYQPVAKQFQEQCLSLSKLQPPLAAPSLEPLTVTEQPVDKEEVIDKHVELDEPPKKRDKPSKPDHTSSDTEPEKTAHQHVPQSTVSDETAKPIENYAKIITNTPHPASGLSLLADSAVTTRLPLTADRPNMREQLLAKAVEKKQACGRCERCLRLDDCGSCDYCLDKPKFGGPNTKRRKCRQRTCVFYRQTQNGSRKRQNNSYRFDSNSLVASLTPSFMTSMASQRSKEKEPKKTELSTMVQQITTSLANQVEKEAEQQQCNNNNASSSSSDGSNGRRRPAIQCHKCTHCAAPDCAKCRFCLDKPKFGGPGRLKQKCVERRCVLERHQDEKKALLGSLDNLKPIAVEAESDDDVEIDVDDDI